MSGLIRGALKGLADGVGAVAKTEITAGLEREKAAADEARQVRLVELQQTYATQNRQAEQDNRLGNTVLDNQLRGEQQAKEFEFRKGQQTEQIKAQKELASMNKGAGRQMSPAQEREYNLTIQRDAAIAAGDAGKVAQIDKMLGTKGERSDFKVLSEDPVTGAKTYGMMTPEGLMPVPIVGAPSSPGGAGPSKGGWNVNDAVAAASSPGGPKSSAAPSAQPAQQSQPSAPSQSVRSPDGGNRQDVSNAYNAGIKNALAIKQREIVTAERSGDVQSVIKLNQEYQQLQKSMR